MNDLTSSDYTIGSAGFEIILLVAGTFLLGAMFCYLLRMLGLCCRKKQSAIPVHSARDALQNSQAGFAGGSMLDGDREVQQVDINSLIRSGGNDVTEVRVDRTGDKNSAAGSFESRARESLASLEDGTQATPIDYTLDIPVPSDSHVDDLKKLEGIDEHIEKLLNEAGIKSYAKLATMGRNHLKSLLEQGGSQFKTNEPKSWPYQAELAAKDNWNRLKEYQEFLLDSRP